MATATDGFSPTALGGPSETLARLRDSAPIAASALLKMWAAREPDGWRDPEIYRRFGERAFRLGENLLAYDFLDEGLRRYPADLPLRQWFIRALSHSGAIPRALAALEKLRDEGCDDEQTFGLFGSVAKMRWAQSPKSPDAQHYLREAARYYGLAYAHAIAAPNVPANSRVWVGINAATTSILLGDRGPALRLAAEVAGFCAARLDAAAPDDPNRYWYEATIGEASLIRGDVDEAKRWYTKAAAGATRRLSDLGTTRRQARTLLTFLAKPPHLLDGCFPLPRVVRFAGHMIDRPGRYPPRFPPELETAVRDAIAAKLDELNAGFGFGSAACGSDILFQEAMLARDNAESHIVLPFDRDEFRKVSVDVDPDATWGARYDGVLSRASRLTFATDQKTAGPDITYEYANKLVDGLAAIHARQLGAELSLLVVWDGRPGLEGGTGRIVSRWRDRGYEPVWINSDDLLKGVALVKRPPTAAPDYEPGKKIDKQITALLFADTVGFSKLNEDQIPTFVRKFLGKIAELLATTEHTPMLRATWGDGLYLVFDAIKDAGHFAVELQHLIETTKWSAYGLPDDMSLRIGLHAGPTYRCVDPIVVQTNYTGAHVSRAARIEPITPPNEIYASQAFVALAATDDLPDFEWDYVGVVPLAKKYGDAPMYHLRRRGGASA